MFLLLIGLLKEGESGGGVRCEMIYVYGDAQT